MKGDGKTGPFKKNGEAQNSKNGKPRGGSKKIQIYFKQKDGEQMGIR